MPIFIVDSNLLIVITDLLRTLCKISKTDTKLKIMKV